MMRMRWITFRESARSLTCQRISSCLLHTDSSLAWAKTDIVCQTMARELDLTVKKQLKEVQISVSLVTTRSLSPQILKVDRQ